MKNPHVQKVGGPAFNILLVDDWLIGLFKTNNDIWRFLEYLGQRLADGEPVPENIYIFMVAITGVAEKPLEILQTAMVARMLLPINAPPEEQKCQFVYTAIHSHQSEHQAMEERVLTLAADIMETLYEEP